MALRVRQSQDPRAIRGSKRLEGLALELFGPLHDVSEIRRGAQGIEARMPHERRRRMESRIDRTFEQLERSVMVAGLR